MLMRRPVALAIRETNPFVAALSSMKNMTYLLVDFMYGTPERVKVTLVFALALAALGGFMVDNSQQFVCTNTL